MGVKRLPVRQEKRLHRTDVGKLTEQTLERQASPRRDTAYACLKSRGNEAAERRQLERQLERHNWPYWGSLETSL